jgi:outer membrane protein OmpA-like peptidoglycan-associated protein
MFSLIIFLSLLNPAVAQDTVDAHGFNLAASDGELHDGLSVWRGERQEKNSFAVGGLFEYADSPLSLYSEKEGVLEGEALISDLTALNLGVHYAPVDRLALTVATPLYLNVNGQVENGTNFGDVRFAAPIGLVLPNRERVGFGLSVVPLIDVPGAYADGQLGQEMVSGGGLVAASVGDDRWDVSGNAGIYLEPEVDLFNLRTSNHLLTGLSASYSVTEEMALRAEGIFKPSLGDVEPPGSDSPAELLLSARGYTGENVTWTLGGATAVNEGVGAAIWRVFGGLNVSLGARHLNPDPVVVCDPCRVWPVDLLVRVTNEDGEILDVPFSVEDHEKRLEITTGELGDDMPLRLPPNIYRLTVTVPDQLVVVGGNRIFLMEPILFDFDKATIRFPESHDILTALVGTLKEHPEFTSIEVAGHTDERGSVEYNDSLSTRRMNSVVDFLVENGIERDRLVPVGHGERSLLEEDCGTDEACHQLNRRVEFTILEGN